MANPQRKPEGGETQKEGSARNKPYIVDAVRHVGPTLEAEGQYNDVLGTRFPTPESQIAADAGYGLAQHSHGTGRPPAAVRAQHRS